MQLRQRIDRYLKRSGMRPTTFGRMAARDPRLVFDLRNGREPRRALARRLGAFLDTCEQEFDRAEGVQ